MKIFSRTRTLLTIATAAILLVGVAPIYGQGQRLVVSLPQDTITTSVTNFTRAVTTTQTSGYNINGFEGRFTFDSSIITFQSPAASAAGLTAGGNWTVIGTVTGTGQIKTLILQIWTNVTTSPLTGSGTLCNLNMTRVSSVDSGTDLIWQITGFYFGYFDADLNPVQTYPHDGKINIDAP